MAPPEQPPGTASVGPAKARGAGDPPPPSDSLPDGSPEGLKKVADGEDASKLTVGEERGALDWVLGATKPVEYDVPVKFDTPDGTKELTFHIRQLDGKKIIGLEDEHRKGSGPFAELDDIAFNAALAAEATVYLTDPTGRKVAPNEPDFIAGLDFGGPAEAMRIRFKYQPGLLDGIAGQIRSVSGYAPDRVGEASRANAAQADETLQDALGG